MSIRLILSFIKRGDLPAFFQSAAALEAESVSPEEKETLVRAAARAGQAEILRYLFEHHLYTADLDAEGRTLLHEAALSGNAETARFAMDVLGFDPLCGDCRGVTPLDLASSAEDPAAFLLLSGQAGFEPSQGYRNPVLRGFHPDPSAVRVGEDYYLVTSSFMYFPALPVFHSRDLVHWREIGHAVHCLETSGLAGLPGGYGYWAPDISYFRGRFWVVATLRRNTAPFRLQMITSALDPAGPWEAPRFLPLDGIDPSLFADEDGRRYILLNPGAMIAEIDERGGLLSAPEMISFGAARIKPEGPHLLKKDGWYYLFLAEGGTGEGHMETVARSRALRGPYAPCPFNPILGRKSVFSPVQRSGHGKPLQLPDGRWYMLYLCGRPVEGKTLMGRETALDPITWTQDGWPMVNHLKGPSCLQRRPFLGRTDAPLPGEAWISPRSDPAAFAQITDTEIRLSAGADPAGTAPCSLLLHRQQEAAFIQEVTVDLSGTQEGTLGALAGYYDERSFYLFGLRKDPDAFILVLTEQIGAERTDRRLFRVKGPAARLMARGSGLERRLCLMENGTEAFSISLRTEYLCDEGLPDGKRFTGALLGLAAVGFGEVIFRDHALRHRAPAENGGFGDAVP